MMSLTDSVLSFSLLLSTLSLVSAMPDRSVESDVYIPAQSIQDYPYSAIGDGSWDTGPVPMWKRAPASTSFYAMRGKKSPYYQGPGYLGLGLRERHIESRGDLDMEPVDSIMGQKRAPAAKQFMGLRGKRTLRAPAHH